MDRNRTPNRLIHEKSPYLLQHAYNPVDWYPWGEEAFIRAQSEQKPIFLSIGYSTCHWCHVMERESFESEATAALLNARFISIKVDREERPDVDRLYMNALHAMGENGGWPMSMFLTPDRKPFYGGTYFPPASRHGRPGFSDLLRHVSGLWESDRAAITGSAETLTRHLVESAAMAEPGDLPGTDTLVAGCEAFARTYDPAAGGFGDAPKFPRASVFSFLLGCFHYRRRDEALVMTATSLRHMAEGGVYDQLGGGFHRYSVDAAWRVPHFEKMLYDQAQLVCSFVDVYRISRDPFFSRIAGEVLEYVKRDLALPGGGFASAEDADSDRPDAPHERGEGAFYIWTRREITELLGEEEGEVFCHYYGIEEEGNALADPHKEFAGRNVLYVAHPLQITAAACARSPEEVGASLSRSRSILLAARATRPRPLRDDKVLTAWNGLMISAFARAATALGRPGDLEAAVRAAEFVLHSLRSEATGELFRRWREGEARHPAQLDDYAFFCQGLLDLYQASFDLRWLREALALTRLQIDIFRDDAGGGFFDSPGGDSSILMRTRDLYDGAEPSGNAVAALNLLRLANLTGDDAWRVEAERTLTAAGELLRRAPHAAPFMAAALDVARHPAREVVLAGRREDELTRALMREVTGRFLPDTVLLLAAEELAGIAPFAASLGPVEGKPAAYVCSGQVCRLPITDAAALGELLDGEASSP